jgi:hypothetical protein
MSKVDAQRALRDARYARFAAARAAEAAPTKSAPAKAAPKTPAAKPEEPVSEELFSAVPVAAKKSERSAKGAPQTRPFTDAAPVVSRSGTADPVLTDPTVLDTTVASAPASPAAAVLETTVAPAEASDPTLAVEELCGHRSMNGRTCTRAKGHEQKNHRYN